jgi:glutarate dioxygenase
MQNLEYVPFMRFSLANSLLRLLSDDFAKTVRHVVRDRASGGFTVGVQGLTGDRQDFIKFGTAVGHIFGPSNHDAMSGKYYATFLVKHTDNSDSYLRQAYRALTLHTDGTFVDEATDWQLMMKFAEKNARGGESRLMRLDDWEDFDRFANDPLGARPIVYKAPDSKNVGEKVTHRTFFDNEYGRVISFIDQFAYPQRPSRRRSISGTCPSRWRNRPRRSSCRSRSATSSSSTTIFGCTAGPRADAPARLADGLSAERRASPWV